MNILVLIYKGLSRPRAHGLVGCLGKKSPVTRPGIDPGTFRIVAQPRAKQSNKNFFLGSFALEMGSIGCPETSINSYQYTLRNDAGSEDLIYTATKARNLAVRDFLFFT
jgi:hypothetical protein